MVNSQYNIYIKKTLQKTEGGIQEWTIQRNWQHWLHKTKTQKTQHVLDTYTQTNTNNVNKTCLPLSMRNL